MTAVRAAGPAVLDAPWDLPFPARTRDRRGWLGLARAREVRVACGISQATIAAALGMSRAAVGYYEAGVKSPAGQRGAAYCRVIAGLARHLEVPGV